MQLEHVIYSRVLSYDNHENGFSSISVTMENNCYIAWLTEFETTKMMAWFFDRACAIEFGVEQYKQRISKKS